MRLSFGKARHQLYCRGGIRSTGYLIYPFKFCGCTITNALILFSYSVVSLISTYSGFLSPLLNLNRKGGIDPILELTVDEQAEVLK